MFLDDLSCLSCCPQDSRTQDVQTFVGMLVANMVRKEAISIGLRVPKMVECLITRYSMAVPSWYSIQAPKWNFYSY